MQNEKVCWTYVLSNLNLGTRLYLPEESILQNEKGCWTCILSDLNLRIRLLCLYQFQFEMGKTSDFDIRKLLILFIINQVCVDWLWAIFKIL